MVYDVEGFVVYVLMVDFYCLCGWVVVVVFGMVCDEFVVDGGMFVVINGLCFFS